MKRLLTICVILIILTIAFSFTTFDQALALNYEECASSQNTALFDDKEIDEWKYLYGENGTLDYLYVNFKEDGYIILQNDTIKGLNKLIRVVVFIDCNG